MSSRSHSGDSSQKTKSRPPRTRRRFRITTKRLLLGIGTVCILFALVAWLMPTTRWVQGSGYVTTLFEAEMRPSVEGTIRNMLKRSGDRVDEDELVVQLNDDVQQATLAEYQGRIRSYRAELEKIRAAQEIEKRQLQEQVNQAQLTLDMAGSQLQRMSDISGYSPKEIEEKKLRVELAISRLNELQVPLEPVRAGQVAVVQEQIAAAEKMLIRLDAEIKLRQIRAPVAGTLQLHRFELGEFVKTEHVLGQIFDRDQWIVRLDIPERYIGYVQPEQTTWVSLAAYPPMRYGTLEAHVSRIEKVVSPRATGDGIFYVQALLTAQEAMELYPGMTAWARIDAGETNWLYRLLGW